MATYFDLVPDMKRIINAFIKENDDQASMIAFTLTCKQLYDATTAKERHSWKRGDFLKKSFGHHGHYTIVKNINTSLDIYVSIRIIYLTALEYGLGPPWIVPRTKSYSKI